MPVVFLRLAIHKRVKIKVDRPEENRADSNPN
jgi:hypothetical protein